MNYNKLENITKGYANHWRIKILELLDREGELSLDQITEKLNGHFKTISVHTKRAALSGLVSKRYQGRSVMHSLTERGKHILTFLRMLE